MDYMIIGLLLVASFAWLIRFSKNKNNMIKGVSNRQKTDLPISDSSSPKDEYRWGAQSTEKTVDKGDAAISGSDIIHMDNNVKTENMGKQPKLNQNTNVDNYRTTGDTGITNASFEIWICSNRGLISDWLRAGTELVIEVKDNSIRALRRGGNTVGIFPRKQTIEYLSLPQSKQYRSVVVIRDVNLNDKYGQCIVCPKY